MNPILGNRGIKPDMIFVCQDCEEEFTGQEVLDDTVRLHFVESGKDIFRCECCQEDYDDKDY
jgi:hypothetical protein